MKIVISGSQGSGKTSFIKLLDTKAMCVEEPMSSKVSNQKSTTVAMDVGSLKHKDITISLFGTPGFNRFMAMRSIVMKGADALIFFLDGTNNAQDKDLVPLFREILVEIKGKKTGFPIIFAVSKVDVPKARTAPQVAAVIKELLSGADFAPLLAMVDARVFEISVQAKKNCDVLLDYVVNKMIERWRPMVQVANKFKGDLPGLQKYLNLTQDHLKEFLNDLEIRKLIQLDQKKMTYELTALADRFL